MNLKLKTQESNMEPKKVTAKFLEKILEDLKNGSENAIGNYLFKGFRIQISKYKSSGTERYMRLYRNRREQGLCVRCGIKVTDKNPRSGKLYRLCQEHRESTDRKKR
jgi:hypothetical protein